MRAAIKARFPQVEGRKELRDLTRLVSGGAAFDLRTRVMNTGGLIGQRESVWVLASDDVDMLLKGRIPRTPAGAAEGEGGPLSAAQIAWVDELVKADALELHFNKTFFTHGGLARA